MLPLCFVILSGSLIIIQWTRNFFGSGSSDGHPAKFGIDIPTDSDMWRVNKMMRALSAQWPRAPIINHNTNAVRLKNTNGIVMAKVLMEWVGDF